MCCDSWGRKESDTTERLNGTELNSVFPGGASGKESTCQCKRLGDTGSIPGLGSFSGGGNGNSLQYSCLENVMDRETW